MSASTATTDINPTMKARAGTYPVSQGNRTDNTSQQLS